jgi:hypothetical protein
MNPPARAGTEDTHRQTVKHQIHKKRRGMTVVPFDVFLFLAGH